MGPGSTPSCAATSRLVTVAEEHEVEQLCEKTVALRTHLLHARDDFLGPLPHELEASHHLRVLAVVTEQHQREHLPRDVAVLAPSADVVVGEFGHDGR